MDDYGRFSKEALEGMLDRLMSDYGSPQNPNIFVSPSFLTRREARLLFGLKIPWSLMIEEDCQYVEIDEFGV